ncbi:MAG TPA: S24 family peptidase [Sphingomicrobium sp.]
MSATGESPIYRELMRFKPQGLSPNAWAIQAGVSRTVWADMRRHGNPSRRTLEKLLIAAGSSLAEFEALRLGPEPPVRAGVAASVGDPARGWGRAQLPPLPLIASSLGGEWGDPGGGAELTELRPGELLDQLERPRSLAFDPDAFALTVVGDSMWPRFRPGSRIAISPRSPVAIGDDVLVRLAPRLNEVERVLIRRLVKKGAAGLELRQFNPDLVIRVETGDVDAVLKIVGELI